MSPGFRRMANRAGPEAMEAVRQRTLEEQRRAVSEVAHPPTQAPGEERADGYPCPRAKGRKRTKDWKP